MVLEYDEHFPAPTREVAVVAEREVGAIGIQAVGHVFDATGDRQCLRQVEPDSQVEDAVTRVAVLVLAVEILGSDRGPLQSGGKP